MILSKFRILGACTALAFGGSVQADPITTSGSGVFSAFVGYGYQYTATWEATAGNYTLQVVPSSSLTLQGATIVLTMTFQPVGNNLFDVPTFDFQGAIDLQFINLSTGLPALPSALTRPDARHQGTASALVPVIPRLQEGGIRLSHSEVQSNQEMENAAGSSVLGFTFPQEANNVLHYDAAVHFVAGNTLQPSPDPTCASISCMVPDHDALNFRDVTFRYTASTVVPEPASVLMWVTGLLGIAVSTYGRRRKASGA
jgi:hypothetical protein